MKTQFYVPMTVDFDPYYQMLAGGGRGDLLKSFFDMGLDKLLEEKGPLTEQEIISTLKLHELRGRKWVYLLTDVGILTLHVNVSGQYIYGNSDCIKSMKDPHTGYFKRDFYRFWRLATDMRIVDLIKGMEVKDPVPYPPKDPEYVEALHAWMREDALSTLNIIQRNFDFTLTTNLLDIGGGDATMACRMAQDYPHLKITVFNLPQAAILCRKNIAEKGVGERVNVHEGDFHADTLPTGFKVAQYSRVLADWPPEATQKMIDKAYAALDPGGWLIICEPFKDQNVDLSIAWEHAYLAYDDFGAYCYKPVSMYYQMLRNAGFAMIQSIPRDPYSVYGTLLAHKPVTQK